MECVFQLNDSIGSLTCPLQVSANQNQHGKNQDKNHFLVRLSTKIKYTADRTVVQSINIKGLPDLTST